MMEWIRASDAHITIINVVGSIAVGWIGISILEKRKVSTAVAWFAGLVCGAAWTLMVGILLKLSNTGG